MSNNAEPEWPIKKIITQWEANTPDGIRNRGFNECYDLMIKAFIVWQSNQPKQLSVEEMTEIGNRILKGNWLLAEVIAEAIHTAQRER